MILIFYLTSCKRMKVYSFVIMGVFRLIVFVFILKETKGESFYISPGQITDWSSATRRCRLAEPDLIFLEDGLKVNISLNISDETQLWTGYYAVWTAMEYFGCAEISGYIANFKTKKDPGHCFSACSENNIIGISGHECFCFETNATLQPSVTKNANCNNYCDERRKLVCGGSDRRKSYMSLYRSIGPEYAGVTDVSNADFGNKVCMYYEDDDYEWESCSKDYAVICGNGNSIQEVTFICKGGDITWVANDYHKYDWMDGTIQCFFENARPSTYNTTKYTSIDRTGRLWTGVIRLREVRKYTTHQRQLQWADRFGYLRLNDDGDVVLDWGKFDDENLILCVNETTTTTTSSTTTTSLTTRTSSRYVTTTTTEKSKTSPDTTEGTTDSNINVTHSMSQTNNEGPSDVGLIVGASVSVVVVIVIVIVVFVLLLRRRGNKQKQPPQQMSVHHNNAHVMSAPGQNEQNTDSQEEYADIDMTSAATGDEQTSDYAHDYFVLEKTGNTHDSTKDGRAKGGDQGASNSYSNSGYEDGPYGTTEGVNQKPHEAHFNPYNHLGGYEEESSNYDHIGKNKNTNVGRFTTDAENTYNTTNLEFLKNSYDHNLACFEKENPDYDHIGNDKAGNAASRNMADEDNTYNKTNTGFLKTRAGASDNIYSVTNTIDPDDTYSHINGKKKPQTGLKSSENDYDTFKK